MPRLVNKLPKYSLNKSSGHAKVRYKGKTTYLGRYGSAESRQAYAEFIANLPQHGEQDKPLDLVAGVSLLIGECVTRYCEHADEYYRHSDGRPTTEPGTIRCSLRPLVKLFSELPADEFTPARFEQLQAAMIELGWARSYCNKATGVVKRLYKWAARKGYVRVETWQKLQTVDGLKRGRTGAKETKPVGPVSDEILEATLPHVSQQVADACRLMRVTGMRPGEVLTLTAADLDRSDPALWQYRPQSHKNSYRGQARTIFIGARGQAIVASYLLRAGGGPLFRIRVAAFACAIRRACRRAGIPHWHPNMIRHAVATEVRSQYGLEVAQCVLGHTNANITQTYAERDMSRAAEVARRIG
jgi:integrase